MKTMKNISFKGFKGSTDYLGLRNAQLMSV